MIKTTEQLEKIIQKLKNEPYIAVDTEFLWRSTYYPKLCLIQIATKSECFIIDTLSDQIDLAPLKLIFEDEKIIKILHAYSQDIKIIYKDIKAKIHPFFDTQIAGEFLGLSHQCSLQGLLSEFKIAEIDKSQTLTDWTKRPLTSKQLEYAEEDVIHLIQTYHQLQALLVSQKKDQWIQNDFLSITQDNSNYEQPDPKEVYKKISSYRRADHKGKYIIRELCTWREIFAQDKNMCQQWVISNKSIVEIAKYKPFSLSNLKDYIFCLHEKQIRKYGKKILDIILDSDDYQPESYIKNDSFKKVSSEQVKSASEKLATLCGDYNIIPQTVAPKHQIKLFLNSEGKQSTLSSGWRYEYFGQYL